MMHFISLYFLLGIQFVTLGFFVLNYWLGLRLDGNLALLAAVLFALVFIASITPNIKSAVLPRFSKLDFLLSGVLIFIVAAAFFTAFWYPVIDWDAVTLFDFRAKVIMNTGWIKDTFPRASIVEYPLLTTLSHWWLYSLGMPTLMPLYPVFFGTFLAVCYHLLRRLLPRTPALLAIMLIAATPKLFDQSLIAYANMPYTVYLILGAVYLFFWIKNYHPSDLGLGILLSVLSLWARTFPFFAVNILTALLVYPRTRKLGVAACLLGLFGLIVYFWPVQLSLLFRVVEFIKWGIVQYYFPYSLLLFFLLWHQIRQKSIFEFWPILIIGYYLTLLAGTYQYGLHDPNFTAIPDTLQRTFMFINPAISWYAIDHLRHRA